MKKILVWIIIGISLNCTACNNSNDKNLKLISIDQAENVVKSEYVSRFKRTVEDTISNNEIVLNEEEKTEKEDEYDKKYIESEVFEEQVYGGKRDRYKDFAQKLSTFRTEHDEINKLHDKLIEVSTDVYYLYNEMIELALERDSILKKEGDITEKEDIHLDEVFERIKTIQEMVDNQIEHVENIGAEIFNELGL